MTPKAHAAVARRSSRDALAVAVGVAAAIGVAAIVVAGGASHMPGDTDVGARSGVTLVVGASGAAPRAVAAVLNTRAPLGRSEPVRLAIPAIDVDTPLMSLGLLADGSLEVPPDGFPAGWYTGAPTPGEMGPAVIAGHVDHAGPAVFHDLKRMKKGDRIEVTRADGSLVEFVVTKVGRYAKNKFPTTAVYGPINFAGLRLITCGGEWDASTGHYKDNVVVFAALMTSTPAPA